LGFLTIPYTSNSTMIYEDVFILRSSATALLMSLLAFNSTTLVGWMGWMNKPVKGWEHTCPMRTDKSDIM